MSKHTERIAAFLVSAGIVAGTTTAGIGALQGFSPDLISRNETINLANELNADTSYFGSNMRFIAPRNGFIKINIAIDELTQEETDRIEDVVDELNSLFSVINPKYKFKVNFNPSTKDLMELYTINVHAGNISSRTNKNVIDSVAGMSSPTLTIPTVSGLGVYKSKITIDSSYLAKNFDPETRVQGAVTIQKSKDAHLVSFINILVHELAHSIAGLGDAYKLDDIQVVTVMDSVQSWLNGFSDNDILLLASKMSDSPNISPEKLNQIRQSSLRYKDAMEDVKFIENLISTGEINSAMSNKYKSWEPITDPIQLKNIGNTYSLKQSTDDTYNIKLDNSNSYRPIDNGRDYTTRYISIENDEYTNASITMKLEQGSKACETIQLESFDGILRNTHTNTYFAKSGDNLLQITVRKNEYGERYIHCVSVSPTVSKQEFDETISDINARFDKNGYLPYLSEQISLMENGSLQLPDIQNSKITTSSGDTFTFEDKLVTNQNNKLFLSYTQNNIVFAGDEYYFIQKDDGVEVCKFNYDFFENELTIEEKYKLTEKEKTKQADYDMTR